MKRRGLYGQAEGNERRTDAASFAEHIEDNRVIEGEHVAALRRMAKEKNWKQFDAYVAEKLKGFSHSRIDSIISSAMTGVRL